MSSAEEHYPPSIPPSSNDLTGSEQQMDQPVHSPEHVSKNSLSGNLQEIESNSYKPLTVEGGTLTKLNRNAFISLSSSTKGLSEQGKQVLADFISRASRGYMSTLPMKCRGKRCPFISVCPLEQAKAELPIDESCPVEATMVQLWVNKHLEALDIKDIDNPENSFDLDILYEIAANELIRWRLAAHLSDSPSLVQEKAISATPKGEPIFAEVISPALEALDSHSRLIGKLREALIATRRAQIQAGRDMGDPSRKASEQAARAREIMKERVKQQKEEIKEADFTVRDDVT